MWGLGSQLQGGRHLVMELVRAYNAGMKAAAVQVVVRGLGS